MATIKWLSKSGEARERAWTKKNRHTKDGTERNNKIFAENTMFWMLFGILQWTIYREIQLRCYQKMSVSAVLVYMHTATMAVCGTLCDGESAPLWVARRKVFALLKWIDIKFYSQLARCGLLADIWFGIRSELFWYAKCVRGCAGKDARFLAVRLTNEPSRNSTKSVESSSSAVGSVQSNERHFSWRVAASLSTQ